MAKVLFLHKCFIQGGGVERVHQNLALAFSQAGVESVFYVMNGHGESESGYKNLCNAHQAYRCDESKGLLQNIKDIKRIVTEQNIDLIVSATEKANVTAFISKLLLPKVKLIYTRHCAFDVSDQRLPPWAIKALYSLYALNGQIVAVSKALRDQIKHSVLLNKHRVSFIPNAVISNDIYERAHDSELDAPEKPYFVAVGRLVEQKGFDILLEAYAIALQQNAYIPRLVIYGEGEDRGALESQARQLGIADKVELAGFTNNPYAPIKHAVAFVLSSRHEGMPTVLVESLALGTPVISFDCPTGPAEIVKHAKNGLLVEHLNADALATAMLAHNLVSEMNLCDEVKAFEFNQVARRYLDLHGVLNNG